MLVFYLWLFLASPQQLILILVKGLRVRPSTKQTNCLLDIVMSKYTFMKENKIDMIIVKMSLKWFKKLIVIKLSWSFIQRPLTCLEDHKLLGKVIVGPDRENIQDGLSPVRHDKARS